MVSLSTTCLMRKHSGPGPLTPSHSKNNGHRPCGRRAAAQLPGRRSAGAASGVAHECRRSVKIHWRNWRAEPARVWEGQEVWQGCGRAKLSRTSSSRRRQMRNRAAGPVERGCIHRASGPSSGIARLNVLPEHSCKQPGAPINRPLQATDSPAFWHARAVEVFCSCSPPFQLASAQMASKRIQKELQVRAALARRLRHSALPLSQTSVVARRPLSAPTTACNAPSSLSTGGARRCGLDQRPPLADRNGRASDGIPVPGSLSRPFASMGTRAAGRSNRRQTAERRLGRLEPRRLKSCRGSATRCSLLVARPCSSC